MAEKRTISAFDGFTPDHPLPFGAPYDDMANPALALLECSSIALGLKAADAAVKKAPVQLLEAAAVTPGKFLILLAGGEAEVLESFAAAISACGEKLIDKMLLAHVHSQVIQAATGKIPDFSLNALGTVETVSAASSLLAADRAVKAAKVELIKLRLARGIGGKGYFVLNGPLSEIEAGVAAALSVGEKLIVADVIIANPREDIFRHLFVG
jgi:microcompartment protein CcmL/EutN